MQSSNCNVQTANCNLQIAITSTRGNAAQNEELLLKFSLELNKPNLELNRKLNLEPNMKSVASRKLLV